MVRYLLYILFLYALTAFPSHLAGADPTPVPHAIVILCPGLRVDDLTDPALLHLRALAQRGAVGLMNTAVTEPKTDTAAVQVVARGIGEPARPTAAESYFGEGADMRGVFAGALFEGLASALSPSGSFKSLDAKAGLRTFPSAVDLSHWAAQQPGIVVVRVTAGPDLDALLAVMPLGSVRVLLVSPRPP